MKSKQLQANKRIFALRLLCVFLCVFAILTVMTVGAGAQSASQDIFDKNYKLAQEKLEELSRESEYYKSHDTSPMSDVSQKINQVLSDYKKALIDIQADREAYMRDLSTEINAAYERGEGAGKLSWICYYNLLDLKSEESIKALKSEYESDLEILEQKETAKIIEAEVDKMIVSLNRLAYTKKLEELIQDSDSYEAKLKISGAISAVQSIESEDIFGGEYKAAYEEGKKAITLQRARDNLTEQMRAIFKMIRPQEDFNSNWLTISLGFELGDAQEISVMNDAVKRTLYELTAVSQNQTYAYIFINDLNVKLSDIAVQASKEDRVGDFLSEFHDFDLEYSKVTTKDSIVSILLEGIEQPDEDLKNIEALFNKAGGRIDTCKSKTELSIETARANFFKKLYSSVADTRKKLDVTLSKYDYSEFTVRIDKRFEEASKELEKAYGESQSFDENCNLILKKADEELKVILDEAKAERFLLTYKNIIVKPTENLTPADEIELRACITAYLNLEADVASTLENQINSIVEKYKSVFVTKIRGLMNSDALYLDLCENICEEIKKLSSNDIGVFYNSVDLVFKKALTLQEIMISYREITASSLYQSFTEQEKADLAKLCKDAQIGISQADATNHELLKPALERVMKNTTLSFSRISEYARVRVSARNSKDLDIEKLLSDAKAKISASNDKNEMIAIADASIYKINRVLTVLEIKTRAEKAEYEINGMKFLAANRKTEYISRLKSLKNNSADDASLSGNITVLSFIWNTFSEELTKISSEANKEDLDLAKNSYTQQIDSEITSLSTEIQALGHLATARKDSIVQTLIAAASKFKSELVLSANSKEAGELYISALEDLNAIKLGALGENLSNYKTLIASELEKLKDPQANYSQKNYEKILSIIAENKTKLESCSSIADCSALLTRAQEQVGGVNDLLDDAKNQARDELNSLINTYRKNISHYSKDSQKRMEAIYSDALVKIESYSAISEIGLLNASASDFITQMKGVKKDLLYSPGATESFEQQSGYGAGYDFSNGYWGSISSQGNISFDSVLTIIPAKDTDQKKIQSIIRKAAKNGSLAVASSLSEKQLKLLKKSVVSLALDINASNTVSGKTYTLRMLLPNSLRDENILGIAFVDESGNVEFYAASRRDMLLSVDLTHFSNYYIISEQTVDLTPLLTFLIVFLAIELISLFTVLFLRNRRRRKEIQMLPPGFLCGVMPISTFALRVKPQNGVGLAVLLSIAALTLACGIAFLTKLELGARKDKKQSAAPQEEKAESRSEKLLRSRDIPRLREKMSYLNEGNGNAESVGNSSVATECESDISVIYEDEPDDEPAFREKRFASHRAEINLDVISENFRAGELVTLDALKKKKLISKKADYVKILARGSLTKPLIIEAHDFSRAAEKMLNAVGGEAVRIK